MMQLLYSKSTSEEELEASHPKYHRRKRHCLVKCRYRAMNRETLTSKYHLKHDHKVQ
jgi:hypothetical protein